MKPDQRYLAEQRAAALTPAQREAILILHPTEPVRQRTSGLPGNVFTALRRRGIAEADGLEWRLTAFGVEVQAVLREGPA